MGNNVPVGINMSYVLQNKFRIKITNTTQKTRAGKWIIDSNNLNSTVINQRHISRGYPPNERK